MSLRAFPGVCLVAVIENPILNRPYEEPSRHWQFDEQGLIVAEIIDGRRPSESWIPIPQPKKKRGRAVQGELQFDHVVERRKRNDQVDQIRSELARWRSLGYPDVTGVSRRLLGYWADAERENRILFCQREAAETAIFLGEAGGRQGGGWVSDSLRLHNEEHNAGLPRVAFKMATGSGKTIVMAMLIAWQTLNKVAYPRDPRFARRFLIVTPGITIRDRLRVLLPADDENYYRARDLVPSDLWGDLRRAEIVITNFHSFLLRTTKEGRTITKNTKSILLRDRDEDPFVETPEKMVSRVVREFSAQRGQIIVFNDEAHHCYLGRTAPTGDDAQTEKDLTGQDRTEAKERNRDAGVWFSGLQHIRRQIGIKTVYDLSATPFFLKGSGYPEGYLFPWVVSDFSLMDAIESGIVKIPRVPVDDNATVDDVVYLNLWSHVGDELPKRLARNALAAGEPLPGTLQGALESLYGHYRKAFRRWAESTASLGETPPVFIVVCNNITVSRMVHDFIAGYTVETDTGERHVPGELPLFSNYEDGRLLAKARTILVNSSELESGEAMSADFKRAAADEIEAFRTAYAQRTGRNAEDLDDTAILREVMNTVGRRGKLGEGIRCVVSVSMLTEGWDANTVTHILGVRAFGSQLLCEQVVGRGLRRRSYAVNEDGYFEPEYAEVYGVPFSFMRVEPGDPGAAAPGRTPVRVRSVDERWAQRIVFPKLDGYRIELPDARVHVDFTDAHAFRLTLDSVSTRTETGWYVGESSVHDLGELRRVRTQEVAYRIARRMLHRYAQDPRDPILLDAQAQPRRWMFPDVVRICRRWLDEMVDYTPETFPGLFRLAELEALAAERINQAIFAVQDSTHERILPIFKRFDPEGSTDDVDYFTTKRVFETEPDRCPVNFVVLDGRDGNTWEQIVAQSLEALPEVDAYVKNDRLEFAIPYVHAGRTHHYLPDFLVRLRRPPDDDLDRYLIVEVSGTFKSRAMTQEKSDTTRNLWCAAVNNHAGYGRWEFVEITDPTTAKQDLKIAISLLSTDSPSSGPSA